MNPTFDRHVADLFRNATRISLCSYRDSAEHNPWLIVRDGKSLPPGCQTKTFNVLVRALEGYVTTIAKSAGPPDFAFCENRSVLELGSLCSCVHLSWTSPLAKSFSRFLREICLFSGEFLSRPSGVMERFFPFQLNRLWERLWRADRSGPKPFDLRRKVRTREGDTLHRFQR